VWRKYRTTCCFVSKTLVLGFFIQSSLCHVKRVQPSASVKPASLCKLQITFILVWSGHSNEDFECLNINIHGSINPEAAAVRIAVIRAFSSVCSCSPKSASFEHYTYIGPRPQLNAVSSKFNFRQDNIFFHTNVIIKRNPFNKRIYPVLNKQSISVSFKMI